MELRTKVGKYEDIMMEKENDESYLKYDYHELKKDADALNIKNNNAEMKIQFLKESTEESKKLFEKEVENISLQNKLFEIKVDLLSNHLSSTNLFEEDNQVEMTSTKLPVETLMNGQYQLTDGNSEITTEIKKLKGEVTKVRNEISETRKELKKSLNKQTDEILELSAQVTNISNVELLEESEDLIKDFPKGIEKAVKKLNNIKYHVNNIENILFCDDSRHIILQWKLQNYQDHFDIGKVVSSPIFLTQIKGYCFKLLVGWTGVEKENLSLSLKLCRGTCDEIVEPFNMQYSLEIVDDKGIKLSRTILLSDINNNRERNFTLKPGQNECAAFGYSKFLTMPNLKNYIVNDMLSIECTLRQE